MDTQNTQLSTARDTELRLLALSLKEQVERTSEIRSSLSEGIELKFIRLKKAEKAAFNDLCVGMEVIQMRTEKILKLLNLSPADIERRGELRKAQHELDRARAAVAALATAAAAV